MATYTDCWWFTTATKLYLFNSRFEFNHEMKQHETKVLGSFSIQGKATLEDFFNEAGKIKLKHTYIQQYIFSLKAE